MQTQKDTVTARLVSAWVSAGLSLEEFDLEMTLVEYAARVSSARRLLALASGDAREREAERLVAAFLLFAVRGRLYL